MILSGWPSCSLQWDWLHLKRKIKKAQSLDDSRPSSPPVLPEGWVSKPFLSLCCSFVSLDTLTTLQACPAMDLTPTKWEVKSRSVVKRKSASPLSYPLQKKGVLKTASVWHVPNHPCSSWWYLWDFSRCKLLENECDRTTNPRPSSWSHATSLKALDEADLWKVVGLKETVLCP